MLLYSVLILSYSFDCYLFEFSLLSWKYSVINSVYKVEYLYSTHYYYFFYIIISQSKQLYENF